MEGEQKYKPEQNIFYLCNTSVSCFGYVTKEDKSFDVFLFF